MNHHDLQAAQAAERRWAILDVLYQERWTHVSETVIAAELDDEGYTVSRDELHRDLNYLRGKGLALIDVSGDGAWRALVTVAGADYAEHASDDVVGVGRPDGSATVKVHKLREARWRIVAVLNINGHHATTERSVLRAINDVDLALSEAELRREAVYLELHRLVEIERQESMWLLRLTPGGTDVAEYATDVPTGIARPPKYW